MQFKNDYSVIIWIAYLLSLIVAFAFDKTFLVASNAQIILISSVFIGPTLLFWRNSALLVASAHIVLAIVIHPATTLKEDWKYNESAQFELLLKAKDPYQDWWLRSQAAQTLSTSLAGDSTDRLRRNSPTLYWLFPPSVVLVFWGILALFFLRDESE